MKIGEKKEGKGKEKEKVVGDCVIGTLTIYVSITFRGAICLTFEARILLIILYLVRLRHRY